MPYKSKRKQRKATRTSVSKWYQSHKAERAAYMRKYRRRLKKLKKTTSASSRGLRRSGATAP